jgi:hypothetical protein
MAYNKYQHLHDNIEALRLVFTLEEARSATYWEVEQLERYSGFEGLKFVLDVL